MTRIHVSSYIHARREDVFDFVSDHEGFLRGPGIKSCKVTTPGKGDRNGLGALREVRGGGIRFVEEITVFDRPSRYDYVIRECTLPIVHEGGRLSFFERGDGTEIDWVSDFSVPIPIAGGALGRIAALQLTEAFTRLLLRAKAALEGDRAAKTEAGERAEAAR